MTAAKCHKCESLKPLLVIMQKVRRKGRKGSQLSDWCISLQQ